MTPTGNLKYLEEVLRNEHVTREARQKFKEYFTYDVIPGGKGFTPSWPEGKLEVWHYFKDVMMNPYFAPLMAEDLSGLPKTLMYTCVQDGLCNDGDLYAQRLREAGNNVTYYHNRAGFHGMNSVGRDILHTKDTAKSNKLIRDFIVKNL